MNNKINVLLEKGKAFIQKGRTVKSRGIALTHVDQGYSANLRPISLLMKSDIDPSKLTVDIMKNLEQVELKISMEEFLRRFFDMWSSDAELLTKVLGMKTEFEDNAEDPEDMDAWEMQWQKDHQEYIESRLEGIQLLKAVKEGKELTLPEQFQVFQIRKAFEEGSAEEQLEFVGDVPVKPKTPEAPVVPATPAVPATPEVPAKPAPSVEQAINKTKESPVETEVNKAALTELQKQVEVMKAEAAEMKARAAAADEIIKAHEDARRATMINKATGMSFVAEDQREVVVTALMKAENSMFVSLLEKAQTTIAEKEAALEAKNAEIEEVKKSFADGKEVGKGGDLSKSAKGELNAQQKLDEIIKARALEMAAQAK